MTESNFARLLKVRCRRGPFLLVCASVSLLGAPNAHGELLAHRAFYRMTLETADESSGIHDVSGRMSVEVVDACDGWTVDQRIALEVISGPGQAVKSYSSFLSWESKSGEQFRFRQKTWRNGELAESVSGRAELSRNGGGVAVFKDPESQELKLPPGTLFPTQHTLMVIDHARVGQKFFTRTVFDGSTVDNPSIVSTFIGPAAASNRKTKRGLPRKHWPVRFAYFSTLEIVSEPEFELGVRIGADGVADSVDIDYGDFTIHGELEEFQSVPPNC